MSAVVKNTARQILAVRSSRRLYHRYHDHTVLLATTLIRCFSSSATPNVNNGSSGSGSSKNSTRQIRFPWRHSQHILPKVEMEATRMRGNWRGQLSMAIWERSTALLVKNNFAQVLFGRQWRQDLADNSAWAWSLALASLLSKTFKVPLDDIYSSDGDTCEINFKYTTPYTKPKEADANNKSEAAHGVEESNHKDSTSTGGSDNNDDHTTLVEKNLDQLFQSFYKKSHALLQDDPQPMEITLEMTPVDAELHRLICFPFLSRKASEEDDTRRQDYFRMFELIREDGPQAFFQRFWDFADRMQAERGVLETTVMADVIVDCIEVFQVKDLTTNKSIQGDGIERTVRHVIRMELDVTWIEDESADDGDWVIGNWRVADIDDQLEGKSWIRIK